MPCQHLLIAQAKQVSWLVVIKEMSMIFSLFNIIKLVFALSEIHYFFDFGHHLPRIVVVTFRVRDMLQPKKEIYDFT